MYNVAPYIERCILSLEEQDISQEDYDIICVNDGSPDNCKEIIENLQHEFDNIILINQENQGVSRARNNGMDRATGKYFLFIDPDDFIDNNSFVRVLKTADENDAQVSFLGFTILNEVGSVSKQVFNKEERGKSYCGTEAYFIARGDGRSDPDRMWAVLFEREFINNHNLRYLPDVPYLEDGEFIARILCLAERCIFDGHSFYERTTRSGSATNSKLFHSEKVTNGFLLAASNLKRFQQEQNLSEKQRIFLNQPIIKFVLLTLNSSIVHGFYKRLRQTSKKLNELGLRKCSLGGCNESYHLYGKAYNFSPFLGALFLVTWPRINKFKHLIFARE
jgi:glycosyltransferase involved in cell wall biosynthesis